MSLRLARPVLLAPVLISALSACAPNALPSGSLRATSETRIRSTPMTWQALPAAPAALTDAAGVAVGFSLWVMGGLTSNGQETASASRLQGFNRWEQLATLSNPRHGMGATQLAGERVLITGGESAGRVSGLSELWEPQSQSWQRVAELPTARRGLAVAGQGVFAYAAGGNNGVPSAAFEIFDSRTRQWQARQPLPTARDGAVAAALGRLVVVVGGRTAQGPTGVLEIYDPATDQWTTGPAMPTARAGAASAVYGHHLFVLGGDTAQGPTAVVESFDLSTRTWTSRTPLPQPITRAIAARVGERLAITGGIQQGRPSTQGYISPFPFWQ